MTAKPASNDILNRGVGSRPPTSTGQIVKRKAARWDQGGDASQSLLTAHNFRRGAWVQAKGTNSYDIS